jgi:hypothetical protein
MHTSSDLNLFNFAAYYLRKIFLGIISDKQVLVLFVLWTHAEPSRETVPPGLVGALSARGERSPYFHPNKLSW